MTDNLLGSENEGFLTNRQNVKLKFLQKENA